VLFGGVKVVLCQAELLAARGHDVRIISRGEIPDWYTLGVSFLQVENFSKENIPPSDVLIATYWTTIDAARKAASGEVVHYCQGYEGIYTHNRNDHPAIREAYRHPIPAMVVSPHLERLLLKDFSRPSRVVVQPMEEYWAPPLALRFRRHPGKPARIFLPGPFEADWKGVATGLEAAAILRRKGVDFQLIRVSARRSCKAPALLRSPPGTLMGTGGIRPAGSGGLCGGSTRDRFGHLQLPCFCRPGSPPHPLGST